MFIKYLNSGFIFIYFLLISRPNKSKTRNREVMSVEASTPAEKNTPRFENNNYCILLFSELSL